MKFFKKACALAISFSLVLGSFAGLEKEQVKADDTMPVKYVASELQFRDYVDNNGYVAHDVIETERKGYGDIHKVVLPEDGRLYVSCMAEDGYANMEVFSNFSLTAKIGEAKGHKLFTEDIESFNLKKGTYYLRATRWNGYKPLDVYTSVGFTPKSKKLKASGATSKTKDTATTVNVAKVNSIADFKNYINNDGAYASRDTIYTKREGVSKTYKFTVDSDGWLLVAPFDIDGYADFNLYSNVDLSAKYLKHRDSKVFDDKTIEKVYIRKGTYYYRFDRWNGHEPLDVTAFLGFVPNNSIKVKSIKKSADNASAKITFETSKSGMLRIEKGAVQPRHIDSDEAWHTSNRGNAVPGKTVAVTANGTYTVRLEDKNGLHSIVTFTVSGLKNTTPAKPKVTSAKKNAKLVKGSAAKYTKVVVKIGSKSYTVNVNAKGKWQLKLSKKLKKGTSIKAYCKNSANKKSKSVTYKVK